MKPGRFQFTQKLFVRRGSELLTLRDAQSGCWDLPGGRVSEAEHLELGASLLREVEEELGPDVRLEISPRPLMIFSLIAGDGASRVIGVGYEARFLGGQITISSEHDRLEWVDVESYDPIPTYADSGLLDAMCQYLAHARS